MNIIIESTIRKAELSTLDHIERVNQIKGIPDDLRLQTIKGLELLRDDFIKGVREKYAHLMTEVTK